MLWGAHDASSHNANIFLWYFSPWQNRDSPSGSAVKSHVCKDRTRHKVQDLRIDMIGTEAKDKKRGRKRRSKTKGKK